MAVGLTVSFNCMYCFIWSLVAVIRKHDVKWFIFVSSMSRSSSWCFRIRLQKSFDVFVSILSQCDWKCGGSGKGLCFVMRRFWGVLCAVPLISWLPRIRSVVCIWL